MNLTHIRRAWARRVEAGHTPSLRAEAVDGTGKLYLYDPIDEWFGITARDVVAGLDQLGDVSEVHLHVNSPGGDVFDALAILNTLRQHPARVIAYVDGIAASAASFIVAGVDEAVMGRNSQLMIHDAMSICVGNAADMRETADFLESQSDNIAGVYAGKAGGTVADWRSSMKSTTWYTDAEAVDAGLADRVDTSSDAAATAALVAVYDATMIPATPSTVPDLAASLSPEGNTMDPCSICGARHDAALACPTDSTPRASHPATPAAPASAPAAAPAAVVAPPAAAPGGLPGPVSNGGLSSLSDLYAALTERHAGRASVEVRNALADITAGANAGVDAPAFVGELWSGVRYSRRIVPLMGHGTLTGYTLNGWRWVTKPEVDDYAGNKTAVPSNAADTEPVTQAASRLAGAHDIDRKFRDFNDTAFFQSYYEAMAESYARKSDARAVTAMLAGATDLTATATGLFGAIAEGVAAIDDETDATDTFVVVNKADLIAELLPLTTFDVPAYLNLLGINVDRIKTHSSVTAGHVLVGTQPAVDFYELPGSPIRVEAVDLEKAGIDAGVFGYYSVLIHDAGGLVDVTMAA